MDSLARIHEIRRAPGTGLFFARRRIGKAIARWSIAYFPVAFSRHFFFKRRGWSLDREMLEDLRDAGIRRIIFDDIERSLTWLTETDTFLAHCLLTRNRSGIKAVLQREHWQLFAAVPRREPPPPPGQLSLFSELPSQPPRGHWDERPSLA